MKYIVYCTVCLETGKIYIGVHKTENPNVFDGYIGNGIKIGYLLKNPKTAFQYAVKKYGYSKFKRTVLYIFDTAEEAYQKEAEIVTLEFVKRDDNYNIITGGLEGRSNYKNVYRYRLNGEFWEEYNGIKLVSDKLGCHYISITNACNNRRSFKNSYWSFEKVEKLNLNEYRINKFSSIYQFDLKGNFIKEWESVNDIKENLNLTESNIYSALNKKSSANGFYFLKDKTQIQNILKSKEVYNNLPKLKCGEPRKIAQYTLNNKLIKIWDTVAECSKQYSKCRDVAKGLRKQTKGFIFKYIS